MKDTISLKIILGSVRDGRFSERLAPWVLEQVEKHGGFDAELLDLRDYEMPFFDQSASPSSKQEPYKDEAVARWTQKIAEADAFLFIMPEYNRSVPGVLKNAIDWVYPEWNRKAAGFIGYGTVGGARAIEHARGMAAELQMATVRQAVNIVAHWNLQEEGGSIRNGALSEFERGAAALLEQLKWWGSALKVARA